MTEFVAILHQMARDRGIKCQVEGDRLIAELGGRTATLDLPNSQDAVDALADLPSAFPSRAARGDIREKMLYNIVQDLVQLEQGSRIKDKKLKAALGEKIHTDTESRDVLTAVLAQQYWFHPRAASSPATFLAPFHADLPGAYDYEGRYKSFRGSLLLFLSFDGGDFDLSLASQLIKFMSDPSGLNPLDRELLRVANSLAAENQQRRRNSPENLIAIDNSLSRNEAKIQTRLRNGAFDQGALDLIRRDLATVLQLELPRHDKVAGIVLALSLHVALYYYRIAFLLGEGLGVAAKVLDRESDVEIPTFDGAVRFRVGTRGDRPVSETDNCAQSWYRLDERYLLALPASMISANLLHEITGSSLEGAPPVLPDPTHCALALQKDDVGVQLAEFLAAAVAVRVVALFETGQLEAYEPGAGGHALRRAVVDSFRGRLPSLKQRGRDVVNTLAGGFGGNLKRNRGSVRFFEIDEEVLFLLVKLILDGAGVPQMPFQGEFLPALLKYGLAPQDSQEEMLLVDALQRLGLLKRYSDAGEATYVRHIL